MAAKGAALNNFINKIVLIRKILQVIVALEMILNFAIIQRGVQVEFYDMTLAISLPH